MAKKIAHHIKLYTKSVANPVLTAVLSPDAIQDLAHTTILPGGFGQLRFNLPTTESECWEWLYGRLLGRIVVEESIGRTIWEGRIEGVALVDRWQIAVTGIGYWSNLTDTVRNRSYLNGTATGRSVISELLGSMHAQTRQVSISMEHVDVGPTIVQEYQDDWTIWRILTDRFRGVASFGSGTGAAMDIAMWEGRKLHYAPRRQSDVTWHSYLKPERGGGVVNLPLHVDWRDVANAVVVTYEASGVITRTPQAIDADSIARYIRRERHVPNIGESTAAAAVQRRDSELTLRKYVRPKAEGLAINRVWDTNGVEWPLCRVRAGETIRIPDLTPITSNVDRAVIDAYRTFFIVETDCNHDTGILTIRPAGWD